MRICVDRFVHLNFNLESSIIKKHQPFPLKFIFLTSNFLSLPKKKKKKKQAIFDFEEI